MWGGLGKLLTHVPPPMNISREVLKPRFGSYKASDSGVYTCAWGKKRRGEGGDRNVRATVRSPVNYNYFQPALNIHLGIQRSNYII